MKGPFCEGGDQEAPGSDGKFVRLKFFARNPKIIDWPFLSHRLAAGVKTILVILCDLYHME